MVTPPEQAAQEATSRLLRELGIAVHRHGYRQLCIGIPYYAQDYNQSLTKELYPYISKHSGCSDGRAVERSIRGVISDAWEHRNSDVWTRYFPNCKKPPSNKLFISTLADYLN